MQFYHPQVHLFVRPGFDGPDEYILHAVTFCKRTSFRADGYLPLPAELDEAGAWEVGLKIRQDPELPDFESLTPVVHTVVLGSLPGGAEQAEVKVQLLVDKVIKLRGGEEPKATSTVSTTSASEESRPVGEE